MIDELLLKVKPKDRRIFMMLIPLIGGLLASWALVIKPGLSKLALTKAELRSLSTKEVPFKNITDSEQKLNLYKQKISKAGDKIWLVDQLNSIADKAQFLILSVTPDEQKSVVDGYIERSSIRIEAEGNYHQLGEFVSRVESLEQFVKILTVDINAGDSLGMDFASTQMGPASGQMGATPQIGGAAAQVRKSGTYKIYLSVGLFSPVTGVV
jgi:Tfp pilus assembly protein PilO